MDATNTITVTRRSDLSLLYKVLRTVIKPFRPRLVSSSKRCSAGSPRLHDHPRRVQKIAIVERNVGVPRGSSAGLSTDPETDHDVLWLYHFQAPSKPLPLPPGDGGERTHAIYYFAGGGFQCPPSSEHWKFCAHLASSLAPSRGRITLVSYPLAPESPARDTLPFLRRWLACELERAAAEGKGERMVSLVGDSAGANIALSLGLWCAGQLERAKAAGDQGLVKSFTRLRSVLAISPPTDMRNHQNPARPLLADAGDPVLTKALTDDAARAWSTGSGTRDPYLSPNLADLGHVRAGGLRVNGVVGTADVLAPDSLAFLDKCRGAGVQGSWLVWDGQMHCFPLAACYGLQEGRQARAWVVDTLREVT
ncbi:Alpha/Beta hydrolase protein [Biscogniauxia sp. FL1348]|nr:Alpha/Beta hydrolase protein [Biscogniauxia sp. FL1348]